MRVRVQITDRSGVADVSPEGAAPGSAVTVAGRLMHVTSAGWAGFGNRELKVQFRPAGSSPWTTKGAVRRGADGTVSNSTKFRGNRAGAWRVTFAGGQLNAPSTSAGVAGSPDDGPVLAVA